MASVRKYPSSRYWIGIFYDAAGRQFRRTTRETTKARAQLVANQFERAAKSKGSVQRVRQTLNEFLREHYADDIESVSVKDFCAGWLSARQAETASGTHRRYKDTLAKFLAFLGPRASRSLRLGHQRSADGVSRFSSCFERGSDRQPRSEDRQDGISRCTSRRTALRRPCGGSAVRQA
jgi:hypothetical protein